VILFLSFYNSNFVYLERWSKKCAMIFVALGEAIRDGAIEEQ